MAPEPRWPWDGRSLRTYVGVRGETTGSRPEASFCGTRIYKYSEVCFTDTVLHEKRDPRLLGPGSNGDSSDTLSPTDSPGTKKWTTTLH